MRIICGAKHCITIKAAIYLPVAPWYVLEKSWIQVTIADVERPEQEPWNRNELGDARTKHPAHVGGQNTFEVDGSRERDPVGGPSGSVGHEVLGLRRAARSGRACRVVRAAYDMGNGRIIQVILEERVDERCNLWSYMSSVSTAFRRTWNSRTTVHSREWG